MKILRNSIIVLFALFLCNLQVFGFEINGIYYQYTYEPNNVKSVAVTYNNHNGTDYIGNITIPETVTYEGNTYEVTAIEYSAFMNCTNLLSVSLPSTVFRIESEAFSGCKNLKQITLSDNIKKIGTGIFSGCQSLESIHIPSGLTIIPSTAFYQCYSLKDIAIPNSVTSIGTSAFQYCNNLNTVIFEDGLKSLGSYAFSDCNSLKSIKLPSTLKSMSSGVFHACSALEEVISLIVPTSNNWNDPHDVFDNDTYKSAILYIPKGTTDKYNVLIRNNLEVAFWRLFKNIKELSDIYELRIAVNEHGCVLYDGESISDKTITHSVEDGKTATLTFTPNIGYRLASVKVNDEDVTSQVSNSQYTINNISQNTTVTVTFAVSPTVENFVIDGIYYKVLSGNTVEVIQNPSGSSYSGNITIPNTVAYEGVQYTVTSIGNSAFANCNGLTSVSIPSSVTNIGSYAFLKCYNLASVNIPNGVTTIGEGVFYSCSSLPKVTIPNGVTTIDMSAFRDCSSLTSVTIPSSVMVIQGNPFEGCTSLASIVVESGNTEYDSRNNCNAIIETSTNTLFVGCKNTVIPSSVKEVGGFTGCSSLTSITIPYGVETIGSSAFAGCVNLASISFSNSVETIDSYAFQGCTALTSVTIPSSVKTIGYYAFQNCSSLSLVKSEITSPFSIQNMVFKGISSNAILQVPEGTKSSYQALSGWSTYFSEIVEVSSTLDPITRPSGYTSTDKWTYTQYNDCFGSGSTAYGCKTTLFEIHYDLTAYDALPEDFSLEDFEKNYLDQDGNAGPLYQDPALAEGSTLTANPDEAQQYILVKGKWTAVKNISEKIGTITYLPDEDLNGVRTSVFEWKVNPDEAIELFKKNKEVQVACLLKSKNYAYPDIYVIFKSDPNNIAFLQATVTGEVDFDSHKISNYWYSINSNATQSDGGNREIHAQTLVPENNYSITANPIYVTLSDVFVGNFSNSSLTPNNWIVITTMRDGKIISNLPAYAKENIKTEFVFETSKQVGSFKGYLGPSSLKTFKFFASDLNVTDVNRLKRVTDSGLDKGKNLYAYVSSPADAQLIAKIEGDDLATMKIVLQHSSDNNGYIEALLNYKAHNQLADDVLKAAVSLIAWIDSPEDGGICEIPLSNNSFLVRFLRPINVSGTGKDVTDVSLGNGGAQTILLDDLISYTDCRDTWKPVFNPSTNKWEGVDYKTFYGVQAVKLQGVEIGNSIASNPDVLTTLNQANGKWILLSGVSDKVDFYYTAEGKLQYRNLSNVSEEFKIQLPVSVEYLWGTVYQNVEVTIKPNTYSLSISASGGGTVSYNSVNIANGTQTYSVNGGSSATLTFNPNIGYRLKSVKVNNTDVTSLVEGWTDLITNGDLEGEDVSCFYSKENAGAAEPSVITDGVGVDDSRGIVVHSAAGAAQDWDAQFWINLPEILPEGTKYRVSFAMRASMGATADTQAHADPSDYIHYEMIGSPNFTTEWTTYSKEGEITAQQAGPNGTGGLMHSIAFNLSKDRANDVDFYFDNIKFDVFKMGTIESNNQYTINNILQNTTVSVIFEEIPVSSYSLSISASSGGMVSYNSENITNGNKTYTINEGSSAVLTFTPNTGYRLASVKVNNTDVTSQVSNNKYTISNISKNTTVEVTFQMITYSLSITSSAGGAVSYNSVKVSDGTQNFSVNSGSSATLTFTPNAGYRLAGVKVNNTDVTSQVLNNQYTISNISQNTSVVVTFEAIPTYSLSIMASAGGTVSYNGANITNGSKTFSVYEGSSVTLTITPNSGYRLVSVKVNNMDVTSQVLNNQYTISNITQNAGVIVTFEEIPPLTYSLNISVSVGGTVSYNSENVTDGAKTYYVNEGSSTTLTFTPNAGYRLVSVKVNNTDVTSQVSNNKYTISNISQNTTVEVTFQMITYSLSITSSAGGAVSYNSVKVSDGTQNFSVNSGSSATLVFTPNSGYRLASLKVNNTDVTSKVLNNQYTISNITQNTEVIVTFEKMPLPVYSLTISIMYGGTVMYKGVDISNMSSRYYVDEGSSATLFITPNEGWRIASVIVNDVDVTSQVSNNQYSINNISYNIEVTVTFEKIPTTSYSLTIKATGEGSVSYNCSDGSGDSFIKNSTQTYSINFGERVIISFAPDKGCEIMSVIDNGIDVTSLVTDNNYTINNFSENTTIEVLFKVIPITTYSLSISASGGGLVSYNNESISSETIIYPVEEGSMVSLTFTPYEEWRIASVKVNDVDVTTQVANNQYTISNITTNMTVEVVFVEDIKALTNDGVNYVVVSYEDKTVKVSSGNYGLCLTVPTEFASNGFNWRVVGIDDDALSGSKDLAAVVWNPSVAFTARVENPNLLMYVANKQYAPSGIQNVIVNGTADEIILTDAESGNNFYCPQEFTASSINYTHRYEMTTGFGETRGWETIALPFDVQQVSDSKGKLLPFATWQTRGDGRPFWLYELYNSGWVMTGSIKANTPYIVSMPNNERYAEEYCIIGNVVFSASNAKVMTTDDLKSASSGEKTFIPNFMNKDKAASLYALNVDNEYENATGGYTEGSVFVKNLRRIHPFEAYMTVSGTNAKSVIAVFEDGTSGIRNIELLNIEGKKKVYNLSGQQIRLDENGRISHLRKGVYIIDGKKKVVK